MLQEDPKLRMPRPSLLALVRKCLGKVLLPCNESLEVPAPPGSGARCGSASKTFTPVQ